VPIAPNLYARAWPASQSVARTDFKDATLPGPRVWEGASRQSQWVAATGAEKTSARGGSSSSPRLRRDTSPFGELAAH